MGRWGAYNKTAGSMGRMNVRSNGRRRNVLTRDYQAANLPIFSEFLCAAELLMLHAAPIYYGLGTPHGDGSGVVLIPAFLCPDHYLFPLHKWLGRIGYESFFSGINFNAECPNLLIKRCLNETMEKALAKTGRRIHLIGHSLGGIIARSIGQHFAPGFHCKGNDQQPIPNAIAVNATGLPRVPMRLTSAPTPKLTPAAMKRPNEVVKANAVARTVVPYCSGSQRLKTAKLPPKKPRKNSTAMKG
jgi:pimeloyl-ACP methyl ester carboxylesterase